MAIFQRRPRRRNIPSAAIESQSVLPRESISASPDADLELGEQLREAANGVFLDAKASIAFKQWQLRANRLLKRFPRRALSALWEYAQPGRDELKLALKDFGSWLQALTFRLCDLSRGVSAYRRGSNRAPWPNPPLARQRFILMEHLKGVPIADIASNLPRSASRKQKPGLKSAINIVQSTLNGRGKTPRRTRGLLEERDGFVKLLASCVFYEMVLSNGGHTLVADGIRESISHFADHRPEIAREQQRLLRDLQAVPLQDSRWQQFLKLNIELLEIAGVGPISERLPFPEEQPDS
ncbi:MAG: hypothetical protein HYY25_05070 [Candidatus Wallbacteria bacterium]|nr:hypothetical protein [Candidatus Wallbacteria bacterium]